MSSEAKYSKLSDEEVEELLMRRLREIKELLKEIKELLKKVSGED